MKSDRYALARRLIEILAEPLAVDGFDLLDVRIFAGGGRLTVRLFVDTDGGMTVERCVAASRTSEMLLEEADPIAEAYVIEVSSPGVRRPLRTAEHFAAAMGQDVILKIDAGAGAKTVRGRLVSWDEKNLVLGPRPTAEQEDDPENEPPAERTIPTSRVREANLDPEFDVQALINADRRRRKEEKKQVRRDRREARLEKKKKRSGKGTPEAGAGDGS